MPEREYDDLFTDITNQVPGALFQTLVTADGHICTPYASEKLRDIYEVSPEQIREDISPLIERFHPEDRARILDSISIAAKNLEKWDCEYRVVLPRQGLKWLHGLGMPRKRADGTVVFYGFVSDITDRKRTEEDHRQAQMLLASIFENAPYALFVKDALDDFRVIQWNRAAETVFGIPAAAILGKTAHDLWPKEQADGFLAEDRAVAASGNMSDVPEEASIHPEKGIIYLHTRKIPLLDAGGKVDKIVVFSEDITYRRLAEQEIRSLNAGLEEMVTSRTAALEAAVREQESFSYSVSHDLRAPLRHINSYSAILQEEFGTVIPPEARYFLDAIERSTKKMGELIDSLLELSRVSRSDLRREPVDLSALATEIARTLQEVEPGRKASFSVEKGLTARGDRVLVKLLLTNLFDNAWKYSAGSDPAQIEFGKTAQEVFFVKDNGVGFDMAYSGKLFEIFQRLHGAEFEGTGIGLATVKRIVERHGGSVWAHGKNGEGATFYFTLPGKEG